MDLSLIQILEVLVVAFAAEAIDSSMGMLYGTIVSASLVGLDFPPLVVVPAVLASQAFAGFVAAKKHQELKNMRIRFWLRDEEEFKKKAEEKGFLRAIFLSMSRDLKVSLLIVFLGSIATVLAVFIAVNIPRIVLETYIGAASLVLGMLLLVSFSYEFTWKKIALFSLMGAFTKGVGGGGFGGILTSGQILSGGDEKSSVGITTLTESLVGLVGFLAYWILKGVSDWEIIFFLGFGAFWGARVGPRITQATGSKVLRKLLGLLVIGLGFLILVEVWVKTSFL